ncbi:MAG: Hcp family type VI secretion system effector [Gemmataceae bacterium]
MPIYVKYGSVTGDVTAEGHANWIEVNSFQWGIGRGISSPVGGTSDRESSAPSISEIVVTKPSDAASYKLLDDALQGEGQDVTIDFCKTDKGKLEIFLSYELSNTLISGYSLSSGGDRPSESLSLNFTKVAMKFVEMKVKNDTGTPASVTYDLGQAKVV